MYDGDQNSPEWTEFFVREREKLRKEGREHDRGTPIQAHPQQHVFKDATRLKT